MTKEETHKEALRRFDLSEAAYSEWRQLATLDLKFCSDEQWDSQARMIRETTGRPCLTADRIAPAIRQIVNESRQNRPAIEVHAKSNGADEDTAKIISGLIRDIEYQSNADIAYDTAEEYAIKCGLGYYRLTAEYEDSESFNQYLCIKLIDDPLCVYFDPDHREPDGSDAEYAFIVKNLTKDAYKRAYGETNLAKTHSWKGKDFSYANWVSPDTVRVAEYFYKEYKKKTLYHVGYFEIQPDSTIRLIREDVVEEKPSDEDLKASRVVIYNTRTADEVSVKWCVLNGVEIIEEKDFPGVHIPVFPVKGEDFWVDGRRQIMGAVRRAKDTQRIINFMISNQVEAVDLANKVPYIGAAGQFDNFEDKWRVANQQPFAYLEYNSVDIDGKPAPAPQRQTAEVPIGAISQTRLQSDDDLKQIFGIYESAQGAQGNETSGVAIKARQAQSSNSNFHFYDNLVRSIKHLGRVIINCIPTYYDTARSIRIVKPDGQQQIVAINQFVESEGREYDLGTGKYDVVVRTGPTYLTKREKLVETGIAIMSQFPTAAPLIADLIVAASDFDGNQEIAARLRTQVPPEVLAATGEDGEIAGDPKVANQALQQQVQAQKQQIAKLNEAGQAIAQELKVTQDQLKLAQQKRDVELLKANQDYDIAAQRLALDEAIAELEWESEQQQHALAVAQLELQARGISIKALDTAAKYVKPNKTIRTISNIKPIEVPDAGVVVRTPTVTEVAEGEPLGNNIGGPKFG
jgi:hypothetical protein